MKLVCPHCHADVYVDLTVSEPDPFCDRPPAVVEMAPTVAVTGTPHEVPGELAGLELYENDEKLCAAWPRLYRNMRLAAPLVDVLAEVRKAHAWEIAHPEKRKKRRGAFLTGWISRAQDRACRMPSSALSALDPERPF